MSEDTTIGRKGDLGKPHLCLLPPRALEEVGKVLTFGAKKYDPDNWRRVRPVSRYLSAALRHLLAVLKGEDVDEETGLPHLAHALCCLMFALDLQLEGRRVQDWADEDHREFFKERAGT